MRSLERRIAALEDSSGDGGCERCDGVVIAWEGMDGDFISASLNGVDITEEELREWDTETKCPQCGRELDPGEGGGV